MLNVVAPQIFLFPLLAYLERLELWGLSGVMR
jgi:hypothetical protein